MVGLQHRTRNSSTTTSLRYHLLVYYMARWRRQVPAVGPVRDLFHYLYPFQVPLCCGGTDNITKHTYRRCSPSSFSRRSPYLVLDNSDHRLLYGLGADSPFYSQRLRIRQPFALEDFGLLRYNAVGMVHHPKEDSHPGQFHKAS